MKKILAALPYQISDRAGYERIIGDFENRGYDIFEYNDINGNDFDFEILPSIIQSILEETNHTPVKIVMISNMTEVIFSWYRCYNDLVDDFIYFIDSSAPDSLLRSKPNYPIHFQLTSFNGIESDPVEGKIFINLNYENYPLLLNFLLQKTNFRYFTPLENFEFDLKRPKKTQDKVYLYQGKELYFHSKMGLMGQEKPKSVFIDLDDSAAAPEKLSRTLVKRLADAVFIIPFLTLAFATKDNEAASFLTFLYQNHLPRLPLEDRQRIANQLMLYLEQQKNFKIRLSLLIYIEQLNANPGKTFEMIMKALLHDQEYVAFHYPLLFYILYLLSTSKFIVYDDYYLDRRTELKRIARFYFQGHAGAFESALPPPGKSQGKGAAIVVDQLLIMRHSPTKVILDYVMAIKKVYPDYSLKIFVTDDFVYPNDEISITYIPMAPVSIKNQEEHRHYLGSMEIDIFYADTTLSRKERTWQIINQITDFHPEVILTTADLSLTIELIYPRYPIVYFSVGGISTSVADLYLYGATEFVLKNNEKHRMMNPDDIMEVTWGIVLPEAKKETSRTQYNLGQDDFILVTVGNRLDLEMTEEFVDLLAGFLQRDPSLKWFLVGPAELAYLQSKYNQIFAKQVIRLNYEEDLASLYRICDVYVNPPREGGGISIAIAMNEGIPIVGYSSSYPCVGYMGLENCAGYTNEDYVAELEKLYLDQNYRRMKSNLMRTQIQRFEMLNGARQVMSCFELAKERFLKRTAPAPKKA